MTPTSSRSGRRTIACCGPTGGKIGRAREADLEVLYDLYEERIDHYEQNPPHPAWDGVFVATSK